MNQLNLWEAMRCRIDQNNKFYRTYRLKHVAQEVQGLCKTHSALLPGSCSAACSALKWWKAGWVPGSEASQPFHQMMLAWCDFQMQVMLKTWPPLWLLIPLPSSWIQPPTLDVESAGRVLVFSSPFPSFLFSFLLFSLSSSLLSFSLLSLKRSYPLWMQSSFYCLCWFSGGCCSQTIVFFLMNWDRGRQHLGDINPLSQWRTVLLLEA